MLKFTGLLYILGAMFYALRVPERWFPGKFDLWVCYKNMKMNHDFLLTQFLFVYSFNHIRYFMCSLLRPLLFTITELAKWQCIVWPLVNVKFLIQLLPSKQSLNREKERHIKFGVFCMCACVCLCTAVSTFYKLFFLDYFPVKLMMVRQINRSLNVTNLIIDSNIYYRRLLFTNSIEHNT